MDQVKFVEDNLQKIWSDMSPWADHITSNFLKAVFHKFYLVYSWIPWSMWTQIIGLQYKRSFHNNNAVQSVMKKFRTQTFWVYD